MARCKLTVIGSMISDPPPPAREACSSMLWTNAGDPVSYPGLEEAIESLVRRVSIASLGRESPGWITSGATEANILSLYYWREKGKKRVVALDTAHYSVRKAARLLGMKYVEIPFKNDIGTAIEAAEREVSDNDVIVATVGSTETGIVDPLELLAELAEERGAAVHVDAAFAGYVMRHLPSPVHVRLSETMATLAVDLHKIPEAPLPLGVILVHDDKILEELFFDSPYIPAKRQFGLLGSRPGCPVYAAHKSMDYLEQLFNGVEGVAKALMNGLRIIVEELSRYGYRIEFPLMTPIACLIHDRIDKIIVSAERKGTRLYTCPRLGGVRIAMMPHLIYNQCLNSIIETLSELATKS